MLPSVDTLTISVPFAANRRIDRSILTKNEAQETVAPAEECYPETARIDLLARTSQF